MKYQLLILIVSGLITVSSLTSAPLASNALASTPSVSTPSVSTPEVSSTPTKNKAKDNSLSFNSAHIGSDSCQSCHKEEHQLWKTSDHYKAMEIPNTDSVLGDFNNVTVEFHGIKTRFFKQSDEYRIQTLNKQGKQQTFKVRYTFGFDPLQQYILDTGQGHMQAFNVAWDSRSVNQGGQRWYHLQPDEPITPDHPFFWQRHFQNWNSRCAECHTTGYEKNYEPSTNSFSTQFAETTVGCESCHGPGIAHEQQAKLGTFDITKGFEQTQQKPATWKFAINDPIANLESGHNDQYLNQCASCHSRRLPIEHNPKSHKQDFDEQFLLDLISSGLYFDDGQINDEVFVMGSFLQSKMAHAGVSCSNCHNPHSAKLKLQENTVCTQCHIASTYDVKSHHHHPKESSRTQCVDCHMPTRTYMQVDKRRDHSFIIPNANVSKAVDSPNACIACHNDKSLSWVSERLDTWSKKTEKPGAHWSEIHLINNDKKTEFAKQKLNEVSPIVGSKLLKIINQQPTQDSVALSLKYLNSNKTMLKRSAVRALRNLPANQAFQYISPLLSDPAKSVRFEAASILVTWLPQMPENLKLEVNPIINEYRDTLMVTQDFPSTQLRLAQLALGLGDTKQAKYHFEQALIIAPNLPIAMLSFADFWRQANDEKKERALLEKALQIHTDFADVLHQYGLFWVRKKEYKKASEWLVKATTLADAQPYYAYVAATALDTINQTSKAIELLLKANQRWPKQTNLLHSLALYSDKLNNKPAMKTALIELQVLMPNDAQVQRWLKKSGHSVTVPQKPSP